MLLGIQSLIEAEADLEIVGTARSGLDAVALIKSAVPDLAIIDISMPGLDGRELVRSVSRELPDVKFLVLTLHEEIGYLELMLDADVRGYVLKRSAAEELVRAIRAIQAGGSYVDPAISGKLFTGARSAGRAREPSQRETEVLLRIAQGFTVKEIAHDLNLGIKTIETYKERIALKLDLRSRAKIVRYAIDRGWLNKT